jgi:hypothetical protein
MPADVRQSARRTNRVERYYDALRNIPPSGGGGCNAALLGVANLGRQAGFSREQVARNLAAHVHGTRKITTREICDAINKAFDSPANFVARKLARVDGPKLLEAIVERGEGFTEDDLWEASPIRIHWPPEEDAARILRLLYDPQDYLFIGDKFDAEPESVRRVADWLELFESKRRPGQHIIPNPLTGNEGLNQQGKLSYRADSCVAQFKLATVEFDAMSRVQQIHFWAGAPLPVVALVDSGGKSIHGWVRINAANANDWTQRVELKLFDFLVLCGADRTSKNESRLSRMPGHYRVEKSRWQRVLYLNPNGGAVIR